MGCTTSRQQVSVRVVPVEHAADTLGIAQIGESVNNEIPSTSALPKGRCEAIGNLNNEICGNELSLKCFGDSGTTNKSSEGIHLSLKLQGKDHIEENAAKQMEMHDLLLPSNRDGSKSKKCTIDKVQINNEDKQDTKSLFIKPQLPKTPIKESNYLANLSSKGGDSNRRSTLTEDQQMSPKSKAVHLKSKGTEAGSYWDKLSKLSSQMNQRKIVIKGKDTIKKMEHGIDPHSPRASTATQGGSLISPAGCSFRIRSDSLYKRYLTKSSIVRPMTPKMYDQNEKNDGKRKISADCVTIVPFREESERVEGVLEGQPFAKVFRNLREIKEIDNIDSSDICYSLDISEISEHECL
jgi:hypothetical protein